MIFYVKKDKTDPNLYMISTMSDESITNFEAEKDSSVLAELAVHALVLSGEDMNKPYTVINP